MARFGKAELKANIDTVNAKLVAFDSPYGFRYANRNGYHTVDLYKDGRNCYAIVCGTARECSAELYVTAFRMMEPRP